MPLNPNMKYTLRVPTKEQYAYIEQEFEGEANDAVEAYNALTALVRGADGISESEFNKFFDTYRTTGKPGDVDVWAQMSDYQKVIINELKKSYARNK